MSLAETQAALARLYTSRPAREAAGLGPEIDRFAATLVIKRRQDVEKWLPATAKALGADYAPLLRASLVEPPPGARADALRFAASLRGRTQPPGIGALADYEAQFVRGWGPRGFFAVRFYRWPSARLAIWARWPGGRMWHRVVG